MNRLTSAAKDIIDAYECPRFKKHVQLLRVWGLDELNARMVASRYVWGDVSYVIRKQTDCQIAPIDGDELEWMPYSTRTATYYGEPAASDEDWYYFKRDGWHIRVPADKVRIIQPHKPVGNTDEG